MKSKKTHSRWRKNAVLDLPLVSCLMVSRGDLFPAQLAIQCFRKQTYNNRELVIVSSQTDTAIPAYLSELNDSSIKFVYSSPMSLGDLRNESVAAANGDFVCTWDDDDLYDCERIDKQVRSCLQSKSAAHFLKRVHIWWPERRLLGISSQRPWENTMMVRRDFLPRYPSYPRREDTAVVEEIKTRHSISLTDHPELYCYVAHSNNTSSTAHFEHLFQNADWIYADYDYELTRLTGKLPVRPYADALVAKSGIHDNEIYMPADRPPLVVISGQQFLDVSVQVDGVFFRNCSFERVAFTYLGGVFPIFENCHISQVRIEFSGSAGNTVNWLRQMKKFGMLDDPSVVVEPIVSTSISAHVVALERP